ncbi:MAG: hypothetical protein LN413_00620 [Candidatus Thermoplasmatota archaeon]|nr:hypothetical protein [Candidatus Thermoplasmatota archaeon]
MKLFVQWANLEPRDYVRIDTGEWDGLPRRPNPTSRTSISDNREGWIFALQIQGTVFNGYDHYAVQELGRSTCRVTAWTDSHAVGMNRARVFSFYPVQPDPHLGGSYNTRAMQTVYAQPSIMEILTRDGPVWCGNGPETAVIYKPWTDFVKPPPETVRHGKWVQDVLVNQHDRARTEHSWREWTEDVPKQWVRGGEVIPGRLLDTFAKAEGTKTFGLRDTDQASGVHATSTSSFENQMTLSAFGAGELEVENLGSGGSELTHLWTTLGSEPNEGTWPVGDYRCQLDASTIGTGITFGLRTAGAVTGHFARVDTGLTTDVDTNPQTEGLFGSPAGDKLATTGSVTWGGTLASDRFECLLAATRAADHGNQPLEMRYDASAFADGPWTVGPPPGAVQDPILTQGVIPFPR